MSGSGFFVEERWIGEGARPLVIAEIGQAHDGSLGTAHAYIDAVADAGADAVKFQTHIAEAESTPGEPWRVRFSPQDGTRYAYWKRMEFLPEQWRGLRDHARERQLLFLSSPFSEAAVELLDALEVPAWKIGSGEVTNQPLLEKIRGTGRPVFLSTGMSSWTELDITVSALPGPKALMQCTSRYPCPPEELGLNLLDELRDRYRCPVGLSDHSATVFAGLGAAALGANLLEVHVVLDRRCFGPDVTSSLTIDELASLVQGVRFLHAARVNPVDKDAAALGLTDVKRLFEKSIVLKAARPAGHVLRRDDLAFKKPGIGIPAAHYGEVLGLRLVRNIEADVPLTEEDVHAQ